jgi:hypothetical protein
MMVGWGGGGVKRKKFMFSSVSYIVLLTEFYYVEKY